MAALPAREQRAQIAVNQVVGVDPGLRVTGYAVVRRSASGALSQPRWQLHEAGVIRPTADESLESRLEQLFLALGGVLDQFRPDAVALEDLHSNYRHPRTAILMGHARGVLCLAAAVRGIPVLSYPPARVKQAVTGSGRASKPQVRRALCHQLSLPRLPDQHDLTDALAVAICCLCDTQAAPENVPEQTR